MSAITATKDKWPELEDLGLTEEQKIKFDRFRFWRVTIAACLFYTFYYLGRLNWGICMPHIIKDLGITKAQAGAVSSALFWCYAIGTFTSGRASEIIGQRQTNLTGSTGSMIMNVVTAMMTSLTAITVAWGANGFFQGFGSYAPLTSILSAWYPKRGRGTAQGILMVSVGIASVVAWYITGTAANMFGWRWAFIWPVVGLMWPAGFIFFLITANKPQDRGFPAYKEYTAGISTCAEEHCVEEAKKDPKYMKGLRPFLYLYSNWKFDAMTFASFTSYIGRYGLLTWIPLYYAETAGIALKKIPIMTLALPIGMCIGTMLTGPISDKVFGGKRWQMASLFLLGSAACLFVLGFFDLKTLTLPGAMIVMVLAGVFVAGVMGSLFTLAMDFGGRALSGTAVGSMNLFNYFAAGLQGLIIGGVLTATGSWTAVWMLCAGMLFLGAIAVAAAKE